MNAITQPQTLITCETTEEHSHPTSFTSVITSSPPVDNVSTSVQGVSGAVYAPMDTTPKQENQQLTHLFKQLQDTITAIIQLSTTSQQTQPDLKDTIETTLQQANWFYDMVGQHIDENHDIESLVDDRVDDRIGSEVDEWLGYNLNINDHVDMDELVSDAVDAKLEDIVEDKLKEMVVDKVYDYLDNNLDSLIKERLQNANITINF